MGKANSETQRFFNLPNGMRLSAKPSEMVSHLPITRKVLADAARRAVSQPTREGGPLIDDHTPEGILTRSLLAGKIGEALTGHNEKPGTPVHRRAVQATEEILGLIEDQTEKPDI